MTNWRIFGLFRQLLKPLLTALVLCCATINVYADDVCYTVANEVQDVSEDGYIDFTVEQANNMEEYNMFMVGKRPLEIKYSANMASPGPSFALSAKGLFYVKWGTGSNAKVTRINKLNKYLRIYRFGSAHSAEMTVKIYGYPTDYNSNAPAITFGGYVVNNTVDCIVGSYSCGNINWDSIIEIGGCLGCAFPTKPGATVPQPLFYGTFAGLKNLIGTPPEDFFDGITGTASEYQFADMFWKSSIGKTSSGGNGPLPAGWFSGLTGASSKSFWGMFSNAYRHVTYPSCVLM